MAVQPGYSAITSNIPVKDDEPDGKKVIAEAFTLPANVNKDYVFKRWPVRIFKAVGIPFVGTPLYQGPEVNKRVAAWATSIIKETLALDVAEVFPGQIVIGNHDDGESYHFAVFHVVFENASYAEMVDAAAILQKHEPQNLFLDGEHSKYPPLEAIIPNWADLKREREDMAKYAKAFKENPLAFTKSDDAAPSSASTPPKFPSQLSTAGAAPAGGGKHAAAIDTSDPDWF